MVYILIYNGFGVSEFTFFCFEGLENKSQKDDEKPRSSTSQGAQGRTGLLFAATAASQILSIEPI